MTPLSSPAAFDAAPKNYSVYVLACAGNRLYTGIALDVDKRFAQHVLGNGAKFTRANRPAEILFQHAVGSKSDALKLEYQIKQLPKAKKIPFCQALAA